MLGCPGRIMSLYGNKFHETPVDLCIVLQCKLCIPRLCLYSVLMLSILIYAIPMLFLCYYDYSAVLMLSILMLSIHISGTALFSGTDLGKCGSIKFFYYISGTSNPTPESAFKSK